MSNLTVKMLDTSTFGAFADMVERNKIWGGCWCLGFHVEPGLPAETTREQKECRVREGRTHAALVFDGDMAAGWCQFGRTEELPRIKHRFNRSSRIIGVATLTRYLSMNRRTQLASIIPFFLHRRDPVELEPKILIFSQELAR